METYKKADIVVGANIHGRIIVWVFDNDVTYRWDNEEDVPPLYCRIATLLKWANARGGKPLQHDWFNFKTDTFRCCRECGCIENKKRHTDCTGRVELQLRSR